MSSFLKSLSGSTPSSRRSSVSATPADPSKPSTSEILTEPEKGSGPKKKVTYSKEQEDKIEELREYAHSLLLPPSDPYHPWELRFLSDPGCIPRYCRAAKWKMDEAKTRIKGTLEWRREYKPDLIKPEDVKVEAETGKIIINGFDLDGRTIIWMRPGRENTQKSPRQILHLIYCLERAIDLCPPGVETVDIVVDYASATSQSNPSIGTARQALTILQNHYVERMGRAIVVNMPWWVNAFFSAIQPFMDPVTREKIRFNPTMTDIIPQAQLDAEFGGDYNYKFDHDIYWKSLNDFCHVAPDGTRTDASGNPTFPPLGNGAKAAAYGLEAAGGLPDVKQEQADVVAGMSPAVVDESKRGGYIDERVAAGTSQPEGQGKEQQAHADEEQRHAEALSGKLAALNTNDQPTDTIGQPAQQQNTDIPRESMDSVRSRGSIQETAQGAPVGQGKVFFDHPPTEEEKEQARDLMEKKGIA